MRVDVACYKVCSFSFCGLKISLIVLRVVCHFFFVLFFCVFYFSYSSVLFWFCYYFLSKPIAILEKSYTLTRTLPFFFPLYQCQPVTTTADLGRFSRSLTFPDDLKGTNRVPRAALEYNNFFKI